jgi:hypothetical protein
VEFQGSRPRRQAADSGFIKSEKKRKLEARADRFFMGWDCCKKVKRNSEFSVVKLFFTQDFGETLMSFTVETSTCSTHGELKIRMKWLSPPIARQKK